MAQITIDNILGRPLLHTHSADDVTGAVQEINGQTPDSAGSLRLYGVTTTTPKTFPDLQVWLPPSAWYEETTGATAATPSLIPGAVIGTWKDCSGNGNHFSALSDAARPVVLPDLQGYMGAHFDGTNDGLVCATLPTAISGNVPYTLFMVVRPKNPTGYPAVFFGFCSSSSDSPLHTLECTSTPNFKVARRGNSGNASSLTTGTPAAQGVYILRYQFDGTHGTLYVNGTQVGSSTDLKLAVAYTVNRASIGSLQRLTPSGFYWGSVGEVIAYNRVLTTTECAQLENEYLNASWRAPAETPRATRYEGNPVLTRGAAGQADSSCLRDPCLLFDRGIYYMYYTVYNGSTWAIAYATSSDMVTWTKQGVVLSPGAGGTWDADQAVAPFIFKDDGAYYLFYRGRSAAQAVAMGIATATSPAGPWTKYASNPIISDASQDVYDSHVLRVGTTWYMAYISRTPYVVKLATAAVGDPYTWDTSPGAIISPATYSAENPRFIAAGGQYYCTMTDTTATPRTVALWQSTSLTTGWREVSSNILAADAIAGEALGSGAMHTLDGITGVYMMNPGPTDWVPGDIGLLENLPRVL